MQTTCSNSVDARAANAHVGRAVRKFRIQAGKTQAQLAADVRAALCRPMDASRVSRLELGQKAWDVPLLSVVAGSLDVPMRLFFEL